MRSSAWPAIGTIVPCFGMRVITSHTKSVDFVLKEAHSAVSFTPPAVDTSALLRLGAGSWDGRPFEWHTVPGHSTVPPPAVDTFALQGDARSLIKQHPKGHTDRPTHIGT